MKHKTRIAVISAVILLGTTVAALFSTGVIVLDHSAQRGFENSVVWQGHTYVTYSCPGKYHEGNTIAMTTDGLRINEVEEDPTHTFIVLRSFLDQWLLVREDYIIPEDGGSIFHQSKF